ncbi:MAG: Mrp/NBP35 family ATP-binding protein [Syntrophaceae bacterium]|nr:Mrp/NBP35 family ATP-binding protein [Syntrophaceae bacterium]
MTEETQCGSEQNCGGCSSSATCSAETQRKHTEDRSSQKLAKIKYRIAVMSGKGGVGKSTVAVNLATSLAELGYKVGIFDGDVHGPNVPKMLGVDHIAPVISSDGLTPVNTPDGIKVISMGFLVQDNDTPIAWRGPMKHTLFQQFIADVDWGELDYLVIDLPPGTGDEPMSIAQLMGKPLWTVIVTTPQDVALLDSRKSVVFARTLEMNILGIVENMSGMSCPHCGGTIDLFKTGGGLRASIELEAPFLGAIPIDPQIVHGGDSGTPLTIADPNSNSSRIFAEIAKKITDMITSSKEAA